MSDFEHKFVSYLKIGSLGKVNFGGPKNQTPSENQPNPAPGNQFLDSSPQHFPRPQSYGGTANSAWQAQGNQPSAQPLKPDYNRSNFSSVFGDRDGGKKGGGNFHFLILISGIKKILVIEVILCC